MKEKKEEEWTADERILVDEYKLKVKALEDERDKFRKVSFLKMFSLKPILFDILQAAILGLH